MNVEEIKVNQQRYYQLRSTITQKEQPVLLSPILLEPTIKLGQQGLKAARGKLSTSYEIAQPFSSFTWHKMLLFVSLFIANFGFGGLHFLRKIVDAYPKVVTCLHSAYH